MRVLLTGAGGFVGSHVATALLRRGHDVHAVVRRPTMAARLSDVGSDLTLWTADLRDRAGVRSAVRGAEPDAVVHLAWYTEAGSYLHDRPRNLASLAASAALVGHLLEAGCPRLLLGGTCLEEASASRGGPTFYATAKRAVHDLAMCAGADQLEVACGHIFSVYGPREHEGRAVPSITRALLRNEEVSVTEAKQARDYLHVVDVAEGLCTLVESGVVGAVDICSGEPRPIREVFKQIGEATGRGDLIQWGARPEAAGEDYEIVGDPRPLMALGWRPRYSLADGVADTVAWWKAQDARALTTTEER